MPAARLTLIGSIVAVVGLVLLLVEAIRTVIGHAVLGSASEVLMWVGLGLSAVGGVVVICGVWRSAPEPAAD